MMLGAFLLAYGVLAGAVLGAAWFVMMDTGRDDRGTAWACVLFASVWPISVPAAVVIGALERTRARNENKRPPCAD